jgi:hypothetical protein
MEEQLIIPCYDTSPNFDDLHLQDHQAVVQLLQEEALQGMASGHRHFKIKVGRGACICHSLKESNVTLPLCKEYVR